MYAVASTFIVRFQDELTRNQLRFSVDEVQYAKRYRVYYEHSAATVLIFHTGTILVQGKHSFLKTWLEMAKRCVEENLEPTPIRVLPR